jgi:hypothetical protein
MSNHVPHFITMTLLADIIGVQRPAISYRVRQGLLPEPDCTVKRKYGWCASTLRAADPRLFKVITEHFDRLAEQQG